MKHLSVEQLGELRNCARQLTVACSDVIACEATDRDSTEARARVALALQLITAIVAAKFDETLDMDPEDKP